MSKKIKTLIIALGILILLGGGYYGAITYRNRKAAEAASSYTPAPTLGNMESGELVKIEVPGLTLEKKGEVWELAYLEGGIPQAKIELDQSRIQALVYSLAVVRTNRLVDENPSDLSVYGLDKPFSRTTVTGSAGNKAEYLLGAMSPSRTDYYVMEEGNPAVYAAAAYQAENLRFSLDSIRQRALFPAFEPGQLTGFRMERAGNRPEDRIEITVKPESAPPYLTSAFATHILTAPYSLPRAIDGETLQNFITPFNNLTIEDFVEDEPRSLRPYGLDQPAAVFLRTEEKSLELLIGNETNGKRYAKLAAAPNVFTVSGMESVVGVKPFSLIDKFLILINIDSVDRLLISGGEKNLNADFQGKGDDGVYFLDGKKAETKSFKAFYQAVIGILADAEYPAANPAQNGEAGISGTGNLTIEFVLNDPAGERISVVLVPYNRDFYAVRQEGAMEFLLSRNQIREIYEKAAAVTYAE